MHEETHPFGTNESMERLLTLAQSQAKSDREIILEYAPATRMTGVNEAGEHGVAFHAKYGLYFLNDTTNWRYTFRDLANLGRPAARAVANGSGSGLVISDLRTYCHFIDVPESFAQKVDAASLNQTVDDHEGWFDVSPTERQLVTVVQRDLQQGEAVTFAHRGTATTSTVKRIKDCLLICTNRRVGVTSPDGRWVWQLEWQDVSAVTQAKTGFSSITLEVAATDGTAYSMKTGFLHNPALVAWQPVLDEWQLRVQLHALSRMIAAPPA